MNFMINFMKTFNNAEQIINNFNSFFESLIVEDILLMELDVTSSECKGTPHITVKFNDKIVYSNQLLEGRHSIKIEADVTELLESSIEISMLGKQTGDTVLENGNIVKDKFIMIDNLKINNYNITSDPDLFYNKFEYKNNDTNKIESVKSGFWSNSSLILKFSMPFTKWYQENSLRNTVLSDQMKYLDSNKGLVDQQYQKLIEKLKLLK